MKSTYLTRDLNEASFLYASSQKLIQLQNDNGRFWFVFENEPACQQLIDIYWRKETKVDAKELLDSLRSLKDRIFSMQRR
ncbi:MAG: DUF5659 domain-containing protein [Candidatus Omnitrophota bacterium]